MTARAPRLRVDPADEARLADQARALAAGTAGDGPDAGLAVITFRLAGHVCAVEAAAVTRALTRLGPTVDVPVAGGGSRLVAWVDEQPLAVTDLGRAAGLGARPPSALALAPALLLATPSGLAAVAVEGPLELEEAPLVEATGPALRGLPGLALEGRLAGGVPLVSAAWLLGCAGGGAAP